METTRCRVAGLRAPRCLPIQRGDGPARCDDVKVMLDAPLSTTACDPGAVAVSAAGVVAAGLVILVALVLVVGLAWVDYVDEQVHRRRMARGNGRRDG